MILNAKNWISNRNDVFLSLHQKRRNIVSLSSVFFRMCCIEMMMTKLTVIVLHCVLTHIHPSTHRNIELKTCTQQKRHVNCSLRLYIVCIYYSYSFKSFERLCTPMNIVILIRTSYITILFICSSQHLLLHNTNGINVNNLSKW